MPGLHDVAWRGRLRKESNQASLQGSTASGVAQEKSEDSTVQQSSKWVSSNQSRAFSGAISVVQWQEKLVEQELRQKLQLKRDRQRAAQRLQNVVEQFQDPVLPEEDDDPRSRIVPFDLNVLPQTNQDIEDPVVLHNIQAAGGLAQNRNNVVDNTHTHDHTHEHHVSVLPPAMPGFAGEAGWRGSLVNGHGTLSCQLDSTNHLHYHFHGDPKNEWEDEPQPKLHGELNGEQVMAVEQDTEGPQNRMTTHFGGLRIGALATALLDRKSLGYDMLLAKHDIEDMSSPGGSSMSSRTYVAPVQLKSKRTLRLSQQESLVWKRRTLVKEAHTSFKLSGMRKSTKSAKAPVEEQDTSINEFGFGFKEIQDGCERHCKQSRGKLNQYKASKPQKKCGMSKRKGYWVLDEEALNALPDEDLAPAHEYGRWEVPVVKDLSLCGKGKALRRHILQGFTMKRLQAYLSG